MQQLLAETHVETEAARLLTWRAAALADAGLRPEPAVWDDPAVDWSSYGAVLVRSTWDYVPRRDAFLAWARRCPRG